jgi:cytochrome b561
LISHPSQWRNDSMYYGSISRLLHWLIAALIVIMLCLGWSMDIIPKNWKPIALGIHKSTGIIILALAFLRLAWRLYNSPPPLPTSMPRWESVTAVATHWLLYGFLFAMPLTGWAMTSAKGKPIVFLGVSQLPDFVAPDLPLGKWLEEIHGDLAYVLAATIFLHIIAALYHNFIIKDNILKRMWPVFSKKPQS